MGSHSRPPDWAPATGTFGAGSALREARVSAVSVRLPDGRTLVLGGLGEPWPRRVASAEVWDPRDGSFRTAGSLPEPAMELSAAALLGDGRVLVVGGYSGGATDPFSTAFLWDPTTSTFEPVGSVSPALLHTATTLPDGRVLITGGYTAGERASGVAELWSP